MRQLLAHEVDAVSGGDNYDNFFNLVRSHGGYFDGDWAYTADGEAFDYLPDHFPPTVIGTRTLSTGYTVGGRTFYVY